MKNGKQEPTAKIWHKLEAAERAAGIGVEVEPPVESAGKVNDPVAAETEKMEARLKKLEEELEKLAAASPRARDLLEKLMLDEAETRGREFFQSVAHLAECSAKAAEGISDEGLAVELKFTSEEVARNAPDVKKWYEALLTTARGD